MLKNMNFWITIVAICFASAAHATLPLIPESSIGLGVQTQCEQTTAEAVSEPISVVEEQDLQAADPELLKCKELLDKALSATCPTLKKRAGLAAVKSVIVVGSVFLPVLLCCLNKPLVHKILLCDSDGWSSVVFVLAIVLVLSTFPVDQFIKFDDQRLNMLKAFEQAISNMTPEQKTAFALLFKTELEKLLNKINSEKESKKVKVAGIVLGDAITPVALTIVMVLSAAFSYEDWGDFKIKYYGFLLYIPAIVAKIVQSVHNYQTSPEKQKQAIAERLEKIFAETP